MRTSTAGRAGDALATTRGLTACARPPARALASVKTITRSPACSASSPRGKITVSVADDRPDDRVLQMADRGTGVPISGALLTHDELDHLGEVVVDHREGDGARIVGEAHDLLGRDEPLVQREVDPGGLEQIDVRPDR